MPPVQVNVRASTVLVEFVSHGAPPLTSRVTTSSLQYLASHPQLEYRVDDELGPQIDPAVSMLQLEGGELEERVDEHLAGKLEYCEVAVGSKACNADQKRTHRELSGLRAYPGLVHERGAFMADP